MTPHEYTFDLTLTATLRVQAESEEEARKHVSACLDCASSNLGAWPNGEPILAEVSYNREDACDLVEVDGEAV